ncbi:MAG: hypothetical protein JNM00_04160 [Flavobacteriales bacterium]|nr:hypothetical protein [Flavobacteriales bacterium]
MRYLFPLLVLCQTSCLFQEEKSDAVLMHALLIEGEPMDTLFWEVFPKGYSAEWGSMPAGFVHDTDAGITYQYTAISEGSASSASGPSPVAGQRYEVLLETRDGRLEASVAMPPPIVNEFFSGENFTVDPDNPSEIAFLVNWQDMDGYSFLVTLENLEADPVTLPFVETGKFDTFYHDPIAQSFAALKSDFFTYYGHHRLTVYAIDKEYESVFYYLASGERNLLQAAPDNVDGGLGFVTGVSKWQTDIWLNP